MSMVTLKRNIEQYFKKHGAEIICTLARLSESTDSFEAYFENYLQIKKAR